MGRATAVVGALGLGALAACSAPGIRPEGRDVTIGLTVQAAPTEVHDLAAGWLTRRGYVIRVDGGERLAAERPLGPADTGGGTRTSFLEVTIELTGAGSRVEVHGHTAIVSEGGHRLAVEIASSTARDAEELASAISRISAPR